MERQRNLSTPGDTNGDADQSDFTAFQNCLGNTPVAGVCLPLDFNTDSAIDLRDFTGWQLGIGP